MSVFLRDRHSRWEKEGGFAYTRFIFFGPEVWEPAKYQFKAFHDDTYYDGSKVMSEPEFERLMQQQRVTPQLLCCHARRIFYWWFADEIWTTEVAYTDSETVKTLLLSQEREKQRAEEAARGRRTSAQSSRSPVRVPELDPWMVLQLKRGASSDEIKEAYHKQLALYHPDKVAHLGPELQSLANEKAKAINQAYEMLIRKQ